MRRSPRQVAALPARRGGLALPTAMAAVVCGSSVLAIAATGTVALGGGERVAVEITSPSSSSGPASAADGAARGDRVAVPDVTVRTSNASGIPAVGALRRTTGPGTTAVAEAGRPDQPFRPLVRDGAVPDGAVPAPPATTTTASASRAARASARAAARPAVRKVPRKKRRKAAIKTAKAASRTAKAATKKVPTKAAPPAAPTTTAEPTGKAGRTTRAHHRHRRHHHHHHRHHRCRRTR